MEEHAQSSSTVHGGRCSAESCWDVEVGSGKVGNIAQPGKRDSGYVPRRGLWRLAADARRVRELACRRLDARHYGYRTVPDQSMMVSGEGNAREKVCALLGDARGSSLAKLCSLTDAVVSCMTRIAKPRQQARSKKNKRVIRWRKDVQYEALPSEE